MVLIKNPITKHGEIRYFEIVKVFIFVMFLFALYSMKIQNISGFDLAFAVSSSILILVIGLAFSIKLYTDCMAIYNHTLTIVADWLSKQEISWELPRFTIIINLKETIEYYIKKQTQADYCVFQC